MPLNTLLVSKDKQQKKKILVLGSGALSIGQAGEFDYSGNQAIKALLEEGLQVVVVNPNIATVQTDPIEDVEVYLYPVNAHWVEKVIAKEKPVGIMASFGGQTALQCLLDLEENGVLDRYQVTNLGSSTYTLRVAEDRDLFKDEMEKIGVKTLQSFACSTEKEAKERAAEIGYPVIARSAYALGGLGSGFAENEKELDKIVSKAFSLSPQVLIEKSIKGWKEIEYEVMRDAKGNAVTICNMENINPLGVHTGDSVVVCPSQSLSDEDYQKLRDVSLSIVQHLKVVGECNVQLALNPHSQEYYVIEMNARLSRSSALASKASGYPIAFIAAKIACGYSLVEIRNPVTGVTCAFYEPALDYLTLKFPRWDLQKFKGVNRRLGSAMKSVGEVMAIGRAFTEVFQKAYRMVKENSLGIYLDSARDCSNAEIEEQLRHVSDTVFDWVLTAFRKDYSVEKVHSITQMDPWFLEHIFNIVQVEKGMETYFSDYTDFDDAIQNLDPAELHRWKCYGFSDDQIVASFLKSDNVPFRTLLPLSQKIRNLRRDKNVVPFVKRIDTTSGEYPSSTNYLYFTYIGQRHDAIDKPKTAKCIVLGSGSYRIGVSVEFDWCAVSCATELRRNQVESIMVNCNPETVSTDFSMSDKLYFEEINLERVQDIADFEGAKDIVCSMGGQLPNTLAPHLQKLGFNLLGHPPESIDCAEDRSKFSQLLDTLEIGQPRWIQATDADGVRAFCQEVGYPVLFRPSYVISGASMRVVYNEESLEVALKDLGELSSEYPAVVSEFIEGAKEIDFDAVAKDGEIVVSVVGEHVENAGIHSGDATLVVPGQKLYAETVRQIRHQARKMAKALRLNGPLNIQFLAKGGKIKIIECNVRASRSFPFHSKICRVHLAKLATRVMLGQHHGRAEKQSEDTLDYVGVKSSMFSFVRLDGSDPVLGVEMQSTGEVACIGENATEAMILAAEATQLPIMRKGILFSTGSAKSKLKFVEIAKELQGIGIAFYGTKGTAEFFNNAGIPTTPLVEKDGSYTEDLQKLIQEKKLDLVINVPKNKERQELTQGSEIRQLATQHGVPIVTNTEKAIFFLDACIEAIHTGFHDNHVPIPLMTYLENE